uniref:Ketoreductase (KR) domain-containing protein n=1 Tax=Biomphalaria glabrata TaxID=6526 RepID=A0A2C9KUG9_BIOGL
MFDGKVAVITGSSYGIGKCTAVMFAKQRCRIVLCGRNALRLTSVLQECLDVSGGHSERSKSSSVNLFCVGSSGDIPAELTNMSNRPNTSIACWIIRFRTAASVISPFTTKNLAYINCIVNMSSSLSVLKSPEDIVEGMTKAGVDYLTRSFGLSLFAKGIRVNAVLPTLALNNTSGFDWWDKFAQEYGPLHPLYGRNSTLEEQANVVLFLASPEASCISGECLLVDGGITLKGPT